MKKVYQISKVITTVGYDRYDIDDAGVKIPKTNQTISHEGLLTIDQLRADAVSKIAPGEEIEVVVAEGVIK